MSYFPCNQGLTMNHGRSTAAAETCRNQACRSRPGFRFYSGPGTEQHWSSSRWPSRVLSPLLTKRRETERDQVDLLIAANNLPFNLIITRRTTQCFGHLSYDWRWSGTYACSWVGRRNEACTCYSHTPGTYKIFLTIITTTIPFCIF